MTALFRPPLGRLHASLLLLMPVLAWAQPESSPSLSAVVVSASGQAQKSFDAPASVQAIGQSVIEEAGPMVNLSESLNRVPGIVVLNRQNYAQDLQLSIRGSGARAPFGIRGARLVVDGIPATMPDGQGQASTISLPSAQRIEVLRGPLAQLYGNSAAGVVQVFSVDGEGRPQVRMSADAGPQGMRRFGVQASGSQDALSYLLDVSDFSTDGWRAHSAAKRRHVNAKLRWRADDRTQLTWIANVFDQPVSKDPLGLTREQMQANPRQAVANATLYQAGKDVSQAQTGLVWEHSLDADRDISARVYWGQRDLENRLSIPLAPQQAPTAAGGVVRLDRNYHGVGLRYSQGQPLGEGRVQWSLGLEHEQMDEARRGYINQLGVQGELKRDEQDRVHSTGFHAQADWAINEHWSAVAGARWSQVKFRVRDKFIRPGNPDDSGRASFDAANPVVGITRHLGDETNVYVNIGRGFETPTFTEIAYSRDGSGPNLNLRAARSTHLELGLKTQWTDAHRLDAALFAIDTSNEIVVASSSGGRSLYTNAGKTRRTGLELSYAARWTSEWQGLLAVSTLNATFEDAFTSAKGDAIAAGNRLPGIADRHAFAQVTWKPQFWSGFTGAVEWVHRGRMFVNDANTDSAKAVTLLNLRLGWEQRWGAWRIRESVRIDNLTDRSHVGSVIANETNGRYFEPAPGRQWGVGVSATYQF